MYHNPSYFCRISVVYSNFEGCGILKMLVEILYLNLGSGIHDLINLQGKGKGFSYYFKSSEQVIIKICIFKSHDEIILRRKTSFVESMQ